MNQTDRILLAFVIVLIDLVLFVLPLTGIAAAWVLIARPPWFRDFVEKLYADS